MHLKSVLFLTLTGLALGLLVGILDSTLHFVGLQEYKLLNILLFLIFFIGLYQVIIINRDTIGNGLLSYRGAFLNIIYVGIVATVVICSIRFVFLNYIVNVDINEIMNETRDIMLSKYSYYTDDQIKNRLAFIKFTYNPIISSLFYFAYYFIFVIIFAFFSAFKLLRIDRNISLN